MNSGLQGRTELCKEGVGEIGGWGLAELTWLGDLSRMVEWQPSRRHSSDPQEYRGPRGGSEGKSFSHQGLIPRCGWEAMKAGSRLRVGRQLCLWQPKACDES